jgi:hypothetical protein
MHPALADNLTIAVCNQCLVVRALPSDSFPSDGWWLECPVCDTYTTFYRLSRTSSLHITRK